MSAPLEEVEKVQAIRQARAEREARTPTQAQKDAAAHAAKVREEAAGRIQADFAVMKAEHPAAWGVLMSFHRMVTPPATYTGSEAAVWQAGIRTLQDYASDQALLWEQR